MRKFSQVVILDNNPSGQPYFRDSWFLTSIYLLHIDKYYKKVRLGELVKHFMFLICET